MPARSQKVSTESASYNGIDLTRQVVLAVGNARSGGSSKTVSISICITSFSSRKPSITSNIIRGSRNPSDSYLGIAFKVRNTTICVNEMDFLAILSHRLSAGIETSRFFEKIDKKSHHDGLTDQYNLDVRPDLKAEVLRRGLINYSGKNCCGKSAAWL